MMRRYRLAALALALGGAGYVLGVAIARYLGVLHHWEAAIGGLVWVFFVLAGGYATARAFAPHTDEITYRRRLNTAFVLFAGAALVSTVMMWQDALPMLAAWLQFALAAGAIITTAPPLRLMDKGYGEVLLAAGVTLLAPALAFALQTGTWHRLVGMAGLPLFFLALAALLAWDFPNYAAHLKQGRRTLLMRLDWQMAFRTHNVALLTGFLLLALDAWLGLPLEIVLPCGMAFVAALGQIWVLQRVAAGARPPWGWLRTNAVLIVGLTAYLLIMGFWRL